MTISSAEVSAAGDVGPNRTNCNREATGPGSRSGRAVTTLTPPAPLVFHITAHEGVIFGLGRGAPIDESSPRTSAPSLRTDRARDQIGSTSSRGGDLPV